MNKTKSVTCKISVHWIQADIVLGLQEGKIDLQTDSLRSIADKIGEKDMSPQKVKRHLQQLVKLGVVSIIDGHYDYKP